MGGDALVPEATEVGAQGVLEVEFRFEWVWGCSVCDHQRGDGLGPVPQSELLAFLHGKVQNIYPGVY